MAEKGIIIEFDSTAFDGEELLFRTARDYLAELDNIPLDTRVEVQYLLGKSLDAALPDYFAEVKTKKTAAKASREIWEEYLAALDKAVPAAVDARFRAFVQGLLGKGYKVVISTRANLDVVRPAFADIEGPDVMLFHEDSTVYGGVVWDSWRKICLAGRLKLFGTLAVVGSGLGVRSAMRAGIAAVAVMHEHVAYQDFSGADEIVNRLDANAAKAVLSVLHVD